MTCVCGHDEFAHDDDGDRHTVCLECSCVRFRLAAEPVRQQISWEEYTEGVPPHVFRTLRREVR